MIRQAPVIALLLVAAYLVGVSAPCPPRADAGHGRGHTATRMIGADGWCAGSGAATSVSAVCPCGCGEKPTALGARVGVALTAEAAEAVALATPDETVAFFDLARAPEPPVRAIDHVPLPA